jgi:N-acetylmuramoyl-L-alanine amidase
MAFFTRSAAAARHVVFLLTLSVVVVFGALPARAQDWSITKIDGREYVSVENVKKFYGFHTANRTGNSVVLSSVTVDPTNKDKRKGALMKLQIGSQECLLNNVKFIFTYSVESGGSLGLISRMDLAKLIDPVLRPSFIPNAENFKTVILDAGHGGKDPGATNPLGTEAAYNLALAFRVKTLLESSGFKVILTRTSDRYLSLQERVELANTVRDEAIFISLHFNSGGRDARGIETFTLSPPGVAHYGREVNAGDATVRRGNEHDSANIALATSVHGCILRELKQNTFDRGIKRARFSVLSGVRHPAILFEGGFMSHPYEARLINDERYQKLVATGIHEAVRKYRFAVTSKATAKSEP